MSVAQQKYRLKKDAGTLLCETPLSQDALLSSEQD